MILISSLSPQQLLVIAECLKYLILTLGLPEVAGKEDLIFQIHIPLLIESMECSDAASPTQMSVELEVSERHPIGRGRRSAEEGHVCCTVYRRMETQMIVAFPG